MLKPDDSLFFYTDGITEAFNRNEEEFGEERLGEALKNKNGHSVNDIVHQVIEGVRTFTEGTEQSDDITCLALKYCNR